MDCYSVCNDVASMLWWKDSWAKRLIYDSIYFPTPVGSETVSAKSRIRLQIQALEYEHKAAANQLRSFEHVLSRREGQADQEAREMLFLW